MPIYQYRCISSVGIKDEDTYELGQAAAGESECGHEYEVFYTSISAAEREEPSESCPECGGTAKKRLLSTGTSHILKGKGWYRDGY